MDIIRLAEIRNYRDATIDFLYPFYAIELLKNYEFDEQSMFVNNKTYSKWIVECSKFVEECKNWIQLHQAPYRKHVLLAIEEFVKLSAHEIDFLPENIFKNTSDFLIGMPSGFSLEGKNIIDLESGYHINPYQSEDVLRDCQNPKYNSFIKHVSQIHDLLIIGLTNILEEAMIEDMEFDKVKDVAETDLTSTIPLAENYGHKILLLHELGIIDYLLKKYNQNDITDLAKLISFITDINHSTARAGIRQYKTQGKGDVYNRTSVNAINKILVGAKMTPIEFKKA
jgi:hypothetical protein